MSAQIGHAVGDENGKARGGQAGDQTGREVRVQKWYKRSGGWDVYLEPLDAELGARAAEAMLAICENDNIGYDQDQRSTARKAVLAAGSIEAAGPSEVDCSSAVDLAYEMAGLEIERGYTGNLERRYLATGMFKAYRDTAHLESADFAKQGGLYLTAGKHVAMALEDGPRAVNEEVIDEEVSAEFIDEEVMPEAIDEEATPEPPAVYVQVLGGYVNVRVGAGTHNALLFTARKGNTFPYVETDADTGWYGIETPKGPAFISCRPDLTRLVGDL